MRISSERGRLRLTAENKWKTTLTTCWVIWKARCVMIFQGVRLNPTAIIRQVRKIMHELHGLQHQNLHQQHTSPNANTTRTL